MSHPEPFPDKVQCHQWQLKQLCLIRQWGVFLLCREMEFDGGGGDDLGDGKRTSPLVVQFLHGAIRGVLLGLNHTLSPTLYSSAL